MVTLYLEQTALWFTLTGHVYGVWMVSVKQARKPLDQHGPNYPLLNEGLNSVIVLPILFAWQISVCQQQCIVSYITILSLCSEVEIFLALYNVPAHNKVNTTYLPRYTALGVKKKSITFSVANILILAIARMQGPVKRRHTGVRQPDSLNSISLLVCAQDRLLSPPFLDGLIALLWEIDPRHFALLNGFISTIKYLHLDWVLNGLHLMESRQTINKRSLSPERPLRYLYFHSEGRGLLIASAISIAESCVRSRSLHIIFVWRYLLGLMMSHCRAFW